MISKRLIKDQQTFLLHSVVYPKFKIIHVSKNGRKWLKKIKKIKIDLEKVKKDRYALMLWFFDVNFKFLFSNLFEISRIDNSKFKFKYQNVKILPLDVIDKRIFFNHSVSFP